MRLVQAERVHHRADVVARPLLRIAPTVARHIGGRIAPRVIGDAAVMARELAELRLEGAAIAGEFMDEDDRDAGAGLLVIELDPVIAGEMRHGAPPS
jgi:hypothetical protein